jgi:hypothetical protein
LIGYVVERDRPLGPVAIRRLVLLALDDPEEAPELGRAVAVAADGWSESILAENSMSTRWFDAETDLGGRPAWSHVWDQCFASLEQYEAHRRGESAAAIVEQSLGGRSAEVVYVPESA